MHNNLSGNIIIIYSVLFSSRKIPCKKVVSPFVKGIARSSLLRQIRLDFSGKFAWANSEERLNQILIVHDLQFLDFPSSFLPKR